MSDEPRVSIVMPAYQEGKHILPVLARVQESVTVDCEILVVVDSAGDATAAVLRGSEDASGTVRLLVNDYGRGPAHAIRYGVDRARAPVTVVTMADGCDDARQIDDLTRLVERGVVIAAASRYMSGGQQVGGPMLKGMLSRLAGTSLHLLARVGTRDPTNSFKAYSTWFLREVGIDSRHGFEMDSSSPRRPGGCGCPSPSCRRSGSTVRPACPTSSSPSGSPTTCGGTASPSAGS